jgi:hypothetical protein
MSLLKKTLVAAAMFLAVSAGQIRAQSVTEPENKGMGNPSATECIAQAESAGNPSAVNSLGYLGKYQVGEAKLIDTGWAVGAPGASTSFDNKNIIWSDKAHQAGIYSTQDYLNNVAVQDQVKGEIDAWNSNQLSSAAKGMIGQNVDCSGFGGSASTPLTMSMLVQGSQFGAGKVNAWAASGGNCTSGVNSATNDGNNKCVTWGMCHAANCSDIQKDMSKKTCSVVMPMIQAISCSNYTGENLSLCLQARPFLMTQAECDSAETWAQAAPKGPNKDKCENSTFGPGTGSWSFALACSWASDAVADQDGQSNPSPVMPTDPACLQKLTAMGVPHTTQGTTQNGSHGSQNCVITDMVTSSGLAIPFPAPMKMDCNLAIAIETFSQKIKALGVTGYYGTSTLTECRGIRNKSTSNGTTASWHGFGKAFDFSGVIVGGRQVSMGNVNNPGTPDGIIATQVKAIACSTFSGVLTPSWAMYKGTYSHNHVDIGGHYCK